MRAGSSCAAPQTLSAEAASVLKHSLTLARRRDHAQVTPLHVAATLLSSRASSLMRACLKSQPPPHHQFAHHPLQCRALELCFNVALNRLPATPSPLLSAQPSLSNALVAALKRAQAHQRRGCIEQQHHHQQQPLIAIKVELEQLILSILDDPSVSRVMREAGFSSAAVKTNLEDSSINSVFQRYNTSGGIYSTPNSPPPETQHNNNHIGNTGAAFWQSRLLSCASEQNPFLFSPQRKPSTDFSSLDEDVKAVMEVLLRNKTRKNTVIVGDFLSVAENVVAEIMGRVERGDVPEELKSAHFIKFQFSAVALRFMKREEVEMNIVDLTRKVECFASSGGGRGGVIIYTGDLKWTVEIDSSDDEREDGYRPVDHLVAEMGKLLSWYNNNNNNNSNNGSNTVRVWLMAAANYQTYVKCQMKQPPLDVHWALQAVSVSSGGLGLSLNATSSVQDSRFNFVKNPSQDSDRKGEMFVGEEDREVLACCPECKSNYEEEASFKSMQHKSFSLHSINSDTENGSSHLPSWLKPHPIETLVKDDLVLLKRKYNKLCHSLHRGTSHNAYDPNTVITNRSYLGRDYSYPSSYSGWPKKNSIFSDPETISFANDYPAVRTNQTASSLPRFRRQQSCHIDFSFSNVSSRCQPVEPNLDALKGLDDKEVRITLALGNLTYNDDHALDDGGDDDDDDNNNANLVKFFQENIPWQSEKIPSILEAVLDRSESNDRDKIILLKGNDVVGKRRFAVGMAKFVFGSSELLFCTNMRKNVCGRESVERALRDHEKLVVLVEDAGYAGPDFVDFLGEGFGEVSGHAVFILTMDDEEENCYNKSKENDETVIRMELLIGREPEKFDDLLDHKRKADWDPPTIKSKSHKNNETVHVSSNDLDLNIKVDDDDDEEEEEEEEAKANKPSTLRFLEKIKNCYVFNRDSDREARARGMFLSKLKGSFEEVSGSRHSFSVEEKVLEEVLRGSGLYLNSLFEQWLKEVFETSLRRLDSGERERVRIRLCLEGKREGCPEEDGFMGTCLPKSILVSFTG
ncbi:hypothetical protein OROGR_017828 [Orobanche gracilis]